jgi:hypothetical protein
VAILTEALRATQREEVVDLCSGGSGPVAPLQQALATEGLNIRFTLTDRFPNEAAFQCIASESQGAVSFVTESVDARAVPSQLQGFRTLFNAFHHFRPDDAIAILRDAAQAGQPIGIFEISERTLRTLVLASLLTPLLVALATPFIRPFRWSRLFWTYLVPLVPLTCWWDGIVSQFRAYTPTELERLAKATGVASYSWRAGRVPIASAPGYLTYLIGHPDGQERLKPLPETIAADQVEA